MTQGELAAILADTTKRVAGDLSWRQHSDISFAVAFRADVVNSAGDTYRVAGYFNRETGVTTFSLFSDADGRVFGMCVGKDHHNPSCTHTGRAHVHQWTSAEGDKNAYQIQVASEGQPITLWRDFCRLANMQHTGDLNEVPPMQLELLK